VRATATLENPASHSGTGASPPLSPGINPPANFCTSVKLRLASLVNHAQDRSFADMNGIGFKVPLGVRR
jgi:hypothetical protein